MISDKWHFNAALSHKSFEAGGTRTSAHRGGQDAYTFWATASPYLAAFKGYHKPSPPSDPNCQQQFIHAGTDA